MSQQDDMRGFGAPRPAIRGSPLVIPPLPQKVLSAFPDMAQWHAQFTMNFEKWRKENNIAMGDKLP